MRAFAARVGTLMEVAYGRYQTAGFKMPWYLFTSTIKIVITDDLRWVWETWQLKGNNPRYVSQAETTPYFSAATGNVCLKLSQLTTDDRIRADGAHELFHAVQNQYTNVYTMGNQLWWYEGTPDYAAYAIAGQKTVAFTNFFEKTPADYFLTPLTLNEGTHAYQMIRFLNYLGEKQSLDFKALWDYVMSRTDPMSAFEGYVTSVGSTAFSSSWRNFVDWMYFDPAANTLLTAGSMAIPNPATASTYAFPTLAGSYSAAAMYFRAKFSSDQSSRDLTVTAGSDLPSDSVLELWRLPNGATNVTGATLVGVLEGSTRSRNITVTASEAIYVLAMNTGKNTRDLSITVSDSPQKDAGVDARDAAVDTVDASTIKWDSAVKGTWSIDLAFSGTGTGQVYAEPSGGASKGDTCTKNCSITRDDDASITLYATADSTSGFVDWGTISCSKGTATYNPYGCSSSYGGTCVSLYATAGSACALTPSFSLK
jgi:hypothetical protein